MLASCLANVLQSLPNSTEQFHFPAEKGTVARPRWEGYHKAKTSFR
jgi:hypothetical protein